MFVNQSMTRQVCSVTPETSLLEAQALMHEGRFRHLPVVDDTDHLIGIITDRDIRSALPYHLARGEGSAQEKQTVADLTVAEVMTRNPAVLSPVHTIQDALLLIQEKTVGAFPVVDDANRLVGILSVRDLLRAFTQVMGIGEPGTLLGILVEEKVGQLKEIVDIITEENISFGSVLVARSWQKNKRAVFAYLLTNNVARAKKKLREKGFEILDPMQWNLDPHSEASP